MSKTFSFITVDLPDGLTSEIAAVFEKSVVSLRDPEIKGDQITFCIGPTWIDSPRINRVISFRASNQKKPARARLQKGASFKIGKDKFRVYLDAD